MFPYIFNDDLSNIVCTCQESRAVCSNYVNVDYNNLYYNKIMKHNKTT